MTHPKNSTTPDATQHPLLTTATGFTCREGEALHPFAVVSGIDIDEALNFASGLLRSLDRISTTCINSGSNDYDLAAIRFLAQSSKALIDASLRAVEQGGAL